ncbi:MAG TPA: aldolase/citrate lyase family protein [Bordetella sp.]|nr:aldolase/citrate lyase family protein [Bordetella sp.]
MSAAACPPVTPDLRQSTHSGQRVLGTFVKSPSHCVVEILGLSGLDCVVIDAEHAPIGLHALDTMLLAARTSGIAALVRVPSSEPTFINTCLDAGAAGVLVPHIRKAQDAAAAIAASRYESGARGFSPSPRAGRYGTVDANEYLNSSDQRVSVWCQIEDAEALENLDAIANVPGVDCLFIGRQDLALSLKVDSIHHPDVLTAVQAIARVGQDRKVPVGIFLSDPKEAPALRAYGISVFICGSDQSLLLAQARQIPVLASEPAS